MDTSPETAPNPAFDRPLDWVIGGALGVLGLLAALGGAVFYFGIDRSEIARLIRERGFQSDMLTEAEAISATVSLGEWGGLGLVAAGIYTVLLGVAVVVAHGRARRSGRRTPRWIVGVAGAVVNVVLSVIPLSPLLGGGTAGYLSADRETSGIAAGTFAGLFTIIPALIGLVFVSVGVFTGFPESMKATGVVVLAIVAALTTTYFVGLSALGGYIGRQLQS
ncbi:DUF5518 domain-containing protein [Halorhabdus sp. SVX81]|uniref:DUF5518 domain-containing protein n=1 Tax=Halorhabdus sp. SVX81 TaxID=2978283 RepID=UPI0023DAEFAC|nr:DUF5518 domain-containing protein [Halorhabdus sp. SVX81]